MTAWEPQLGTGFQVFGKADGFLGHGTKKEEFNGKSTGGQSTVLKTNHMIKNIQPFSPQNKDSQIARLLTETSCCQAQDPN